MGTFCKGFCRSFGHVSCCSRALVDLHALVGLDRTRPIPDPLDGRAPPRLGAITTSPPALGAPTRSIHLPGRPVTQASESPSAQHAAAEYAVARAIGLAFHALDTAPRSPSCVPSTSAGLFGEAARARHSGEAAPPGAEHPPARLARAQAPPARRPRGSTPSDGAGTKPP